MKYWEHLIDTNLYLPYTYTIYIGSWTSSLDTYGTHTRMGHVWDTYIYWVDILFELCFCMLIGCLNFYSSCEIPEIQYWAEVLQYGGACLANTYSINKLGTVNIQTEVLMYKARLCPLPYRLWDRERWHRWSNGQIVFHTTHWHITASYCLSFVYSPAFHFQVGSFCIVK